MEKKKKPFYKRWWFIVLIIVIIIGAIGSGSEDVLEESAEQTGTNIDSGIKKTEPVKKEVTETSKETLSQRNAVGKAKDYLKIMAFSKSGLITQLEFEGFSNEDATYAIDKLDVDWKEQAVKKGKDYLAIMNYSRSGLIEQLEFEGFSNEEATHAVDEIGF